MSHEDAQQIILLLTRISKDVGILVIMATAIALLTGLVAVKYLTEKKP